jgi:hypothetical protein
MRKHNSIFQVALVIAAIALLVVVASSARAATITVNTTFDPGLIKGVICAPAQPCPHNAHCATPSKRPTPTSRSRGVRRVNRQASIK